jgi:hypothetical protein
MNADKEDCPTGPLLNVIVKVGMVSYLILIEYT